VTGRREWLRLVFIGLVTVIVIAGSTELIARRMFNKTETSVEDCVQLYGKGIPNAVCWDKNWDTPLTEYRFNSCGHRTSMDCGTRVPGVYRIVMIGSSVALGEWVPEEKSLASLVPTAISQRTGRKVELYNEGMMALHPQVATVRFNWAIAAKPDMVLWVLLPYDIQAILLDLSDPIAPHPSPAPRRLSLAVRGWHLLKTLASPKAAFLESATGAMMQHFLFQSQNQYVEAYLRKDNVDPGFLKAELDDRWRERLKRFNECLSGIEVQAKVAGVPLAVVLIPNRAQAALLSMKDVPVGVAPRKLGDEVGAAVKRHGATYVDILPDFRNVSNPEQYYYPVDGHPNIAGHALIADLIADCLVSHFPPLERGR
jgi:hypothetical protein